MKKEVFNMTAYCGIYCADCIHYRNRHSGLAAELKKELEKSSFHKYAEIESPFGREFKHYREFIQVLDALINSYCDSPCRVGGGCVSGPCKIMKCCLDKGFQGCWECGFFESCEKFAFLTPRCGDMPVYNLRKIKKYGPENWAVHRHKFYIWQS